MTIYNVFIHKQDVYIPDKILSFKELNNNLNNTNNAPTIISNFSIYKDDSIEAIKKKILLTVFQSGDERFSFEEMYLFGEKKEVFDVKNVYTLLSNNGKALLTYDILERYFKNIKNISDEDATLLTSLKEKDIIEFDDLLSFDKKEYTKYYSIGQESMEKENNDELFIVHPFLLSNFSEDKQMDIQTTNKKLFFEKTNIINEHELSENTIHLVLVKDLISYVEEEMQKNNLSFNESQLIKLYYPLLFNKNINSIDTLTSNDVQERLMKQTETLIEINDKKNIFEITNNHVQLFRNIYREKKYNLNYIENGIKQLQCFIESNDNIIMPLEFIFKSIHACEENTIYPILSRQIKRKIISFVFRKESSRW